MRFLFLLLWLFSFGAHASECSLYERTHPNFLLDGSHLSTGKCSTCASCHKGGVFLGTPKTCISCHNGDPRWVTVGRSAMHIPTGVIDCALCHNTLAFTQYTMNHTAVTTIACKTCHNGSYTSAGTMGAYGKPNLHIPESQLLNGSTLDCKACHTSTVAFTTYTMNHNSTPGNGAGWCIGCHLRGTSYLGNMERMSLTHHQKTPVPTDCSMAGCHRPLGNTGTLYRKWDN